MGLCRTTCTVIGLRPARLLPLVESPIVLSSSVWCSRCSFSGTDWFLGSRCLCNSDEPVQENVISGRIHKSEFAAFHTPDLELWGLLSSLVLERGLLRGGGDQLSTMLDSLSRVSRGDCPPFPWEGGRLESVVSALPPVSSTGSGGRDDRVSLPGHRTKGTGRGSSSGVWFLVETLVVTGCELDSSGCITFCVKSSKDDFIFLWMMVWMYLSRSSYLQHDNEVCANSWQSGSSCRGGTNITAYVRMATQENRALNYQWLAFPGSRPRGFSGREGH